VAGKYAAREREREREGEREMHAYDVRIVKSIAETTLNLWDRNRETHTLRDIRECGAREVREMCACGSSSGEPEGL
jgi:hypothetical protein